MTSRQIRRAEKRRTRKLARKGINGASIPQGIKPVEAAATPTVPPPEPPSANPRTRAEINRENATHSSGPRTEAGKAKSSMNPLKHGFCAAFSILPSESKQDFDDLLAALQQDHQPANTTEQILVERMAQHHWLGQRAIRLQTELLAGDNGLSEPNEKTFSLYLRYQTANERAFSKCLQDLLKLRNDQRKAQSEISKHEHKEAEEKRKQKSAEFKQFIAGLEAEDRSDRAFIERIRQEPLSVAPFRDPLENDLPFPDDRDDKAA